MVIFYLDQNNFLDLSQDSDRYAINWLLRSESSTSTVSNKNTHLPVFEICVFRLYLWNHYRCKKVSNFYLYPCLKSFQMKKEFLKSGHKIS